MNLRGDIFHPGREMSQQSGSARPAQGNSPSDDSSRQNPEKPREGDTYRPSQGSALPDGGHHRVLETDRPDDSGRPSGAFRRGGDSDRPDLGTNRPGGISHPGRGNSLGDDTSHPHRETNRWDGIDRLHRGICSSWKKKICLGQAPHREKSAATTTVPTSNPHPTSWGLAGSSPASTATVCSQLLETAS